MAALFLLALALILWQALRTKPALPPDFEIATERGEQLSPAAVPSWPPPIDLPGAPAERRALLEAQALSWPAARAEETGCRAFVRISSRHWAERPASPAGVRRWLGREGASSGKPWQLLYLPAAAILDDDDGDGDVLDAGELRQAGPGAEVEVFCEGAAGGPP